MCGVQEEENAGCVPQFKTLDMHGLHSSKESEKWTGIGRFD
jgi:hypothetical protein